MDSGIDLPQIGGMPPQTLWNRHFLLWLLGSGQSQFGSALISIALSFLVLRQTGQAGQMAITLACSLLPNLLMPLAGSWIDRTGVKWPLIGANVVRAAMQLTVGVLALRGLHDGGVPLWVVNTSAFISGLAGSVASPASGAAVPHLVPQAELPRANGLLGSVNQGLGLAGTLLGGMVVASFSPGSAIVAGGLSFLVMAGLLLFVNLPDQRWVTGETPRPSLLSGLKEGMRLMRRSKFLTALPFIGFGVNAAVAPVLVVTPKLMDQLGVGSKGYGTFLALEGVGVILVGVLFAVIGKKLLLRHCTLVGLLLAALAQLGMWNWPTYFPLLVGSLVFGAAVGFINVPLGTLIQQSVPRAFLGRVNAVLNAVGSLGMPLMLLLVSPLADRVPLPMWFGVNALAMLGGAVVWWWLIRVEPEVPALEMAA